MKKSLFILAMLTVLAFVYSCKKDETEEAKTSFSAKVQGTSWTAATIVAFHATGGNYTQITAAGSMPTEQISLYYIGSGTGTFTMNDDNLASAVIGSYTFTSMFSDTPDGEIVITKYDETNKKISGTFHFKGEDIDGNVYTVTEGKFENVDLTIQ
jgi:hypothetical protein